MINAEPSIQRVLVISPASVKINWERELDRWLVRPMRVAICYGNKPYPSEADIVIVNFDIINRYAVQFRAQPWDLLVVDECQYLQSGSRSRRGRYILGGAAYKTLDNGKKVKTDEATPIPAKRSVFLSGTPIRNRPLNFYPILRYLDPARWGNFMMFAKRYCAATQDKIYIAGGGGETKWVWDFSGHSNLDELQRILRETIMVRRLKDNVLKELPPKTRQMIVIEPNMEQRGILKREAALFEPHREKRERLELEMEFAQTQEDKEAYSRAVSGLQSLDNVLFEVMTALRRELGISKIPNIIEHVTDCLESVDKVAIFIHHHEVAHQLHEAFKEYGAVILTGQQTPIQKQAAVDAFQDGSARVFVGSILAAGVGINLFSSSLAVFGEQDWVPGSMDQAADRCVAQGSRILTDGGPKAAEDIVTGDLVYTHVGRYRRVRGTYRRNYTGALVEIFAKRSKAPLKITYGHPVLVLDKGADPTWMPAEEVRIGNYLVVPRPTYARSLPAPLDIGLFIRQSLEQRGPGGSRQRSVRQMNEFLTGERKLDPADDRFLELAGWYLAEGYVQLASAGEKTPGSWKACGWALNSISEVDVSQRLTKHIYELFGVIAHPHIKKNVKCLDLRVSSTVLAQLMGRMFGIGAGAKSCPEWVMQLPLTKLRIVYNSYLLGDGHLSKNPGCVQSACTISPRLVYQMREIAAALGYDPAIRYYPGESKNKKVMILEYSPEPRRPIERHPQYILRRVTMVRHYNVKRLKVLNFRVEEDESYLCSDAIVHNCHRIGQKNNVLCQYLVVDGSMDAKLAQTVLAKEQVIYQALDKTLEGFDIPAGEPKSVAARREKEPGDLNETEIQAIHAMLRTLAGLDGDFARELNDRGFNKVDGTFGHSLAESSRLTQKQAQFGKRIVLKYWRQVSSELYESVFPGRLEKFKGA